ncbi:hypothetical protein Tco_0755054 [Tanacetum coccineum]
MTGGVCTVKKLLDILEALHNGPTGGHHAYCAKSHRLKRSLITDKFFATFQRFSLGKFRGTDISKITRKQSKTGKLGHEN